MNIRALKICIILNVIILLTACGTTPSTEISNSGLQTTEYNWKAEGFTIGDTLEESPLFTVDYSKIEYEKPADLIGSGGSQAVCDNTYYIFTQYYTAQETFYNLCILNTETQDSEQISLTPEQWEIQGGHILGMDTAGPDQCVFWVVSDYTELSRNRLVAGHYYIVYTDAHGNQLKSMDIIETLKEQGIWENLPNVYAGSEIRCDAEGNLYLLDRERRDIYLMDQEGKVTFTYTYSSESEVDIFQGIGTSDGEVIFACGSSEALDFIWLDPETGTAKQLARVTEMGNILKWYGLYGDTLYCATRNQLIGWNVSSGEKEVLSNLEENGIDNAMTTSLLVNGDTIKFLSLESNKRYVLTLSTEEPTVSGEITFVNVCGANSYLAGRAAGFSRENPTYGISYQVAENKDRILMEAATGAGPDVLYVSREDMDHLQANGVLGDLRQLLSQETLDILLPGAVEMGTYDRELLGLPTAVSIRSLITSKQYWQGDSWTVEDVLSILEEHDELTGMFTDVFGQDQYFYNMYFLVGMDMEHSPLIVGEEGRFDSPMFKEILSWVKKKTNNKDGWPNNAGYAADAAAKALQEGEYLGVEFFVSGMATFGSLYARMGEDFQPTGYPTEMGRGNYMQPIDGGMIVVNKNAMEKDGIKELLEYLFSLEGQQRVGTLCISVRMDIPESQLRYMEDSKQYFWVEPGGQMALLPEKYDGTSYLDEYLEFLENAVPYPAYSDELFNIIMEEADGYFYSDRDLDEVARIIQGRVQLYLDERR